MKGLEVWYLVKKYLEKEHHKIVKEDIPLKTVEGMPLDIIENELKAIDIIRNKPISADNLKIVNSRFNNLSYENYIELFLTNLTKEEYDLLKEVLL